MMALLITSIFSIISVGFSYKLIFFSWLFISVPSSLHIRTIMLDTCHCEFYVFWVLYLCACVPLNITEFYSEGDGKSVYSTQGTVFY